MNEKEKYIIEYLKVNKKFIITNNAIHFFLSLSQFDHIIFTKRYYMN